MDVYKFKDYRSLLKNWEQHEGPRGSRSKLAKAAQSSASWMTRVLSENVQLTPDQALGIANFLHLNESETDYFLLLVDLERAATPALKKRIQNKIELNRSESRKLAAHIKADSKISFENTNRYYSSWIYSLLHVACMIRPLTITELAKTYLLNEKIVAKVMRELKEMGLVQLEGSAWTATSTHVHLPSDHPSGRIIHTAWRHRTIQYLSEGDDTGLHYSAVHCLSQEDLETVRNTLKEAILKCGKVIKDSPSQTLAVFCLDWYQI